LRKARPPVLTPFSDIANAFAALNKQQTKSTDFPRVEASCLRLVLPEAAEIQELTFQKSTDFRGFRGAAGVD
jgi:hypothetical protein